MSGLCLREFDLLSDDSWQRVVSAQLAIPEHDRPSLDKVEIVGRIIAGGVIDDVGYCDLTYEQISAKSWNISVSMVKPCIRVWTDSGLLVTVKKSCPGQNGQPGRAPRRVFTFYNPHGLAGRGRPQTSLRPTIERKTPEEKISDTQHEPELFNITELKRLLAEGNDHQKRLAGIALRQAAKVGQF